MSEVAAKLRCYRLNWASEYVGPEHLMREAADEIDCLSAELEEVTAELEEAWEELRLVTAALRTGGQGMSEWHPIETAPKDGTRILAFVPEKNEGYVYYVTAWSDWELWEGCCGTYDLHPTHWQPLPEPPHE